VVLPPSAVSIFCEDLSIESVDTYLEAFACSHKFGGLSKFAAMFFLVDEWNALATHLQIAMQSSAKVIKTV
jgi:hypothetical protein